MNGGRSYAREMWLQPQDDLPGRAPLEEGHVQLRRERTFLWFAAFFVATAVMLPLLGVSKWFGASWVVRQVGLEPPVMLLLPLGVIAWPIAMLVMNLVGDLYGGARARSLVFTIFFVWLGVLGLLWATDRIPDYDNRVTSSFYVGAVLVGSGLLALLVQVLLFAWIDSRWLRHVASTLIATAVGWGLFFLAMHQLEIPGGIAEAEALGVALGAGGYTAIAALILLAPVVMIAKGLAVYLRVELRGTPPSFDDLVDDRDEEPAFTRPRQPPRQEREERRERHFTHEEMAFFDAGESDRWQQQYHSQS
jgi:uncharacterized PurR-regulated membrane protein YhhQ (DUF165 family)